MSDDFKEKLKAYAEGRLADEDKFLMEKELEKLELYQEFLDEQENLNSSREPDLQENIIKNPDWIIAKSKWRARFLNACITLIVLSVLFMTLQFLTPKYYRLGNPSKLTLYSNAIEAAIQTTRPNAKAYGGTFKAGTVFNSEIGVQYSKQVGREEIRGGDVRLNFHFNRPSISVNKSPGTINYNDFYFDPVPKSGESTNEEIEKTMWNTLEKLPEGTVAEAFISFNKLYETEEVLSMFKDKDMDLLWLAVDTGIQSNRNTILGFPHAEDFPELRKSWFDPPPKAVQHYTNAEFRNEYFIDTLKFLNEHKAITNSVDYFGSMPNIEEALSYINKNGVKILGVAVTGPTKEILKLREDNIVRRVIVGETRLWNWD